MANAISEPLVLGRDFPTQKELDAWGLAYNMPGLTSRAGMVNGLRNISGFHSPHGDRIYSDGVNDDSAIAGYLEGGYNPRGAFRTLQRIAKIHGMSGEELLRDVGRRTIDRRLIDRAHRNAALADAKLSAEHPSNLIDAIGNKLRYDEYKEKDAERYEADAQLRRMGERYQKFKQALNR